MKHSAHAPYDEKMKNESCVCKYSLPMLHYSLERIILMEKSSNKLVDISVAFAKSLTMGIFCIAAMLALPIMDFSGIKKAARKMCNPQVKNACGKIVF